MLCVLSGCFAVKVVTGHRPFWVGKAFKKLYLYCCCCFVTVPVAGSLPVSRKSSRKSQVHFEFTVPYEQVQT